MECSSAATAPFTYDPDIYPEVAFPTEQSARERALGLFPYDEDNTKQ